MTETREAPEARPEWPHRLSLFYTEPTCHGCHAPWPCPSQRYLDGVVGAAREVTEGWTRLGYDMSAGINRLRALLDPEPKP